MIAIIRVLFFTRLQLGLQLGLQLCELIEDLYNARLYAERGNGEGPFYKLLCIDGREISNDCVLLAPFVDDEEIVKGKLWK